MKSKLLVLSAALMLVLCGCKSGQGDFKPDGPGGEGEGVDPQVVNVESVSLDKEAATLNIGDTVTLVETVLPSDATNKGVTWAASGNGIVSVDEGLVTALAAGTSTVTVTTSDGNKTAECVITVSEPVTETTLHFGEEASLAPDTWVYWNDQNWCGSNVAVTTAKKVGETLTFEYTATGTCDFGFQVFYKKSTLNLGASYRLTASINSKVGGAAKLNGNAISLVAGDNNVAVKYVEGTTSFSLQVPAQLGANKLVISNLAWEGILDIPGAISVDSEKSTIAFSKVDGAASYLVKYFNDKKVFLDSESVADTGATLTKLPETEGNYYVTVTAISAIDPKYDSIESDYVLFKVGSAVIVPAGGEKANIGFGEETNLPLDKFCYWNDQWWCGSNVVVTSAYTEEGLVHVEYTAEGVCDFGFQIFYKSSSLTANTTYTVSFQMKVTAAGNYHLFSTDNNTALTANTWTTVSYEYVEAGTASLKVCIPSTLAASNTVELKGFTWTAK